MNINEWLKELRVFTDDEMDKCLVVWLKGDEYPHFLLPEERDYAEKTWPGMIVREQTHESWVNDRGEGLKQLCRQLFKNSKENN
jgi:hypothetical protein